MKEKLEKMRGPLEKVGMYLLCIIGIPLFLLRLIKALYGYGILSGSHAWVDTLRSWFIIPAVISFYAVLFYKRKEFNKWFVIAMFALLAFVLLGHILLWAKGMMA